jgi:hypothetical protein
MLRRTSPVLSCPKVSISDLVAVLTGTGVA